MVTFVGHDEPRVKVSFRYAVVQNRCLLPVHDIYDLLHGGRRVVFDARCSANVNTVIILGQTIRNSKSFGYILWLQIAFSLSSLRRKQIPPLPHRCLPGGGDRLTPSPPPPPFLYTPGTLTRCSPEGGCRSLPLQQQVHEGPGAASLRHLQRVLAAAQPHQHTLQRLGVGAIPSS